jgi:HNH endonuclease
VRRGRFAVPMWALLVIAERDNWTCHICGGGWQPGPDYRWEVDHDEALAKTSWRKANLLRNLKLSHRKCNREAGAA